VRPVTITTLSIDVDRPPAAVFATLADMNGYAQWLGKSSTYRGTIDLPTGPIRKGTTYADRIPGMVLTGEVREYAPDRLLVFHQATPKGELAITISYALTPTRTGTHIVRTGNIVTTGWLRLVHPVVVAMTRRENLRTLAALKSYLEATVS
jgi:uncharacterized protein YndB with AHSA1/START domain